MTSSFHDITPKSTKWGWGRSLPLPWGSPLGTLIVEWGPPKPEGGCGGVKGGYGPPTLRATAREGASTPGRGVLHLGGPFSGQGAPNKYPACSHGCNPPPPPPVPNSPILGVTETPHPPYWGCGAGIVGPHPKHHKSWGQTAPRPGLCWGPQPPVPGHWGGPQHRDRGGGCEAVCPALPSPPQNLAWSHSRVPVMAPRHVHPLSGEGLGGPTAALGEERSPQSSG